MSRVGLLRSVDEVVSRLMGVETPEPDIEPAPVYEGRCVEGCGACCNPVTLPGPKSKILASLRAAGNADDIAWMRRLRRLSKLEATNRYRPLGITAEWMAKHHSPVVHYYACPDFVEATRTCGRYETRPPVCRNFPWGYHGGPIPDASLPPTCGYRVDIGLEVQPVTLTRKEDRR